jgi:hypothetical protein
MENPDQVTQPTTKNPENIVKHYDDQLMKHLFQNYLDDGGAPKVTAFKRHVEALITSFVKPLCVHSGKSAITSGWRSELKDRFSGRGAKWVSVSIENITPTLEKLTAKGIDCSDYTRFINQEGYAWIRFAGPRVNDNEFVAAFEVRTTGSKIDHPKQLHYISINELDNQITPLDSTPHAMNIEVIKALPSDEKLVEPPSDEQPSDEIEEEVAVEDGVIEDEDGFTEIVEDDDAAEEDIFSEV